MTMDSRSVDLVDLTGDLDDFTIGGKAAGLVPLAKAGLPVPPAVVVPAEASDADLEYLAAAVAERFAGARLAVRSSGVHEDLDSASFAGQYETVLDVPADPVAVLDAVAAVRASVHREHVEAYAAGRDRSMAVLIMPMIDATAAGIAFTRDPITGADRVVVEAVAGLGHRLASGEEAGELWIVNDSVDRKRDLGVLDADTAAAIARLARECEAVAGAPQDIEWAISDGDVRLLQSRPITTHDVEPIPMDDDVPPGPWEWDSAHNRVPMTPLSSSMFIPGFEAGSRRLVEYYGVPFDHLAMRTINGYLYVQVVPPMGRPEVPPPPAPVMRLMFRLVPPLRRREQTAKRAMSERIDRKLVSQWRNKVRPATESKLSDWYDTDLGALSDGELADRFEAIVAEQRATFGWNMSTDPSYLIPLADLLDFLTANGLGGMETATRLVAGSSRAEYRDSAEAIAAAITPAVRSAVADGNGDVLERLEQADADFARSYARHIRDHGQRVLGFDLIDRTMLEDPGAELARLVTLPPSVDATPEAEALAVELRTGLDPNLAAEFDALVAEARATYPIREEGEAVHARVMGAARLTALEAGRRLVAAGHATNPNHACFLTVDELTGWLRRRSDVRETIRTRRGNRQWALGQTPPAYFGGRATAPDASVFPPNIAHVMRVINLIIAHDQRAPELAEDTDGVAASPGRYTGPARIVAGPQDLGRVRPGDVLVAPITASPWEVVFPHIGALVTEGGGLLSHPAIVAREYRLPAVVGCEGAMSRFHDGQIITVNGTVGTVRSVESD